MKKKKKSFAKIESITSKAELKIKVSNDQKENESPHSREERAEVHRALRLDSGSRINDPGHVRD